MITEQMITDKTTMWPPNRSATRDLNDDFSRMVCNVDIVDLGLGVSRLVLSVLVPITCEPFNWETAEQRADWEENHDFFMEFSDVKDLLLDLHSV